MVTFFRYPTLQPQVKMTELNRTKRRKLLFLGWSTSLITSLLIAVAVQVLFANILGYLLPLCMLYFGQRWMIQPGAVPVLTYHSVSRDQEWLPWAPHIAISPAMFARHMSILKAMATPVVTLHELVAARKEHRALPPGAVVLTFDDGYLDNRVAALPILREHGFRATMFVSLDFIAPGQELRPTLADVAKGHAQAENLDWRGYLNWQELADLQAGKVFDIQAHGTDHARVESGPQIVGKVTQDNWRNISWVQWAATEGNKSNWYVEKLPVAVPLGTPVRESAPALTARAWLGDRLESPREYEIRVLDHLRRARTVLSERLGKTVNIFCWPQNIATAESRNLAHQAGYIATTAGNGENRAGENPEIISRLHIGDRVLGWRCPWADALYFKAQIKVGQGNYYWSILLLASNLLNKMGTALRGEHGKALP